MTAIQLQVTGEILDVKLNLGGYVQVAVQQQQIHELLHVEIPKEIQEKHVMTVCIYCRDILVIPSHGFECNRLN